MASTKFEKLIEHVIAGDEKKARSLFHSIVVDKSRKIYEGLDVDDTERAFDDVEADHEASDETPEFGGDEADDLETDVFADDDDNFGAGDEFSGDEAGNELNPDVDDRVADLESEFDALKAEFEELLAKEEGVDEEEVNDFEDEEEGLEGLESEVEDGGEGEEAAEEEVEDADFDADETEAEDEEEGEEKTEKEEEAVDESVIREYVLKVTQGLANSSEEGFVNKKTPVAKDRPDMGGNAKNLNQGGESQGRPNPKVGELIGDKEVVNRPGRKTVDLKPTPKPVTTKEQEGVNKKSVES